MNINLKEICVFVIIVWWWKLVGNEIYDIAINILTTPRMELHHQVIWIGLLFVIWLVVAIIPTELLCKKMKVGDEKPVVVKQ